MAKECKHGMGEIYLNPIDERCLYCEIWDGQRNIDRGDCLGNCEWEKPGETSEPTNADRIRAMGNEELAEWCNDHNFNCPPVDCRNEDCFGCWLDWLKSPAEMPDTK